GWPLPPFLLTRSVTAYPSWPEQTPAAEQSLLRTIKQSFNYGRARATLPREDAESGSRAAFPPPRRMLAPRTCGPDWRRTRSAAASTPWCPRTNRPPPARTSAGYLQRRNPAYGQSRRSARCAGGSESPPAPPRSPRKQLESAPPRPP